MEEVFALRVSTFGFRSLIALIAWIQITLQHVLRFSDRIGINRAGFDDIYRRVLDRPGHTNLVAAFRQDHIIETTTGHERARRRDTEAHRERYWLIIFIVLRNHLPQVRARRRLEGADISPTGNPT